MATHEHEYEYDTTPATHTTLPLQVNRLARDLPDAVTKGDDPWGAPPIYVPKYYITDTDPANDGELRAQFRVAREYGIHSALVPWKERKSDPIDDLIAIRETVESFPSTKATFNFDEIKEDVTTPSDGGTGITQPRILNSLMATLGAWPYNSGYTTRWVNPNYRHHPCAPYPDLADGMLAEPTLTERRKQWTQWGLSVCLPSWRIAARMDWAPDQLLAQDWPLGDWVEMGRRMYARTIKTAIEWDVSKERAARAYGVIPGHYGEQAREQAVDHLLDTYAPEFEPPPHRYVVYPD